MKPLTPYGRLAEKHWRKFLPKMVAELQAKDQLRAMRLEAQAQTAKELDSLRRHFLHQGLTAQQAHHGAWDLVRERYIFLPPET